MTISDPQLTLTGYRFPGQSSIWRSTFQALQQEFRQAAHSHPNLGHLKLQAIDKEGTIPSGLEAKMVEAGGYDVGKMRESWGAWPEAPNDNWWTLNSPTVLGYVYGPPAARKLFERLADWVWLALPGTPEGKTQCFPQERPIDRWVAFIYSELRHHPGTYLEADEVMLVRWKSQELTFHSQRVKKGNKVWVGYPEADQLPGPVQRWKFSALATDLFTASAVAIDGLLSHTDPEGPFWVSWKEMEEFLESPAYQNSNHLLDWIRLGESRKFPIYVKWCKPIPGTIPTMCPNADPPANEPDRKALCKLLPEIERRYRDVGLIKPDQTIHWVGRQARLGTLCQCNLNAIGNHSTEKLPSPTKGVPGRRGYPIEALEYARKLRQENPTLKAHVLRQKCLEKFSEDDLPEDGGSFRRWLNRKRANRAN